MDSKKSIGRSVVEWRGEEIVLRQDGYRHQWIIVQSSRRRQGCGSKHLRTLREDIIITHELIAWTGAREYFRLDHVGCNHQWGPTGDGMRMAT